MNTPAPISANIPSVALPVAQPTVAAANAPPSNTPSSAILTTPERSELVPPSAASTSGTEINIVCEANNEIWSSISGPRQLSSSRAREEIICAAGTNNSEHDDDQ